MDRDSSSTAYPVYLSRKVFGEAFVVTHFNKDR